MPSWILKTALQHVIGRLPKSYWWNGLFQKYVTQGYYPSRESFEGKLNCCRQHLDHYLKFCPAPKPGFTAMELGTGWWPIIPLGLYLCGASEIWTYDLVPVLRRDTLRRTLELYCEFARTGELERILKYVQPQRLQRVKELIGQVEKKSPAELLKRLKIHTRIGDARSSELPDKSIDLVYSNFVFEHPSADTLNGLLAEFRRIASPHAVMSHHVGIADQYADFDKSITYYNYMKYTDGWWNLLNNPVIPQNRLRVTDYRNLIEQTGWEIVEERNTSGSLDDLNKVLLAPEFKKYSTKDLLVLFSWLVARPIGSKTEYVNNFYT
ncbi:MAG: class I SAM-dependent methyltransferase [Deltaproteobacteria bacterium]|nr:class I SAM-dependent methyltransferase [Deltaproteobacteria bacterium]